MQRVFILFLFLISTDLFSQETSEGTLVFQTEIDSLLIHAWKNHSESVTMIIKSSQRPHERSWKEKIKWRFFNDSLVEQKFGLRNKCYGVIRNDEIFEYDLDKNEVIKYGNSITRDSSGYTIIESDYDDERCKSVSDSARKNTTFLTEFSDGRKLYSTSRPLTDSSGVTRQYNIRNDSLILFQEITGIKSVSIDHYSQTQIWIVHNYFPYDFNCAIDTENAITTYKFDSHGRLIAAHRVVSSIPCNYEGSETDEMNIIYKPD